MGAAFRSMDRQGAFSNATERACEQLLQDQDDSDDAIRAALVATNPGVSRVTPKELAMTRQRLLTLRQEQAEYEASRPAREAAQQQTDQIWAQWSLILAETCTCETSKLWHLKCLRRAADYWEQWQVETFGRVLIHG